MTDLALKDPSLAELDKIREKGLRPGIVACFVNDKKLLMVLKREYNLWLMPQGGISNGETPQTAILREMTEEMGKSFIDNIAGEGELLYEEGLFFSEKIHGERELQTDSGKVLTMTGKHYFFYVLPTKTQEVILSDTEFDDYFWMPYSAAKFITTKMYVKNKGEIILKVLELLKVRGFIL